MKAERANICAGIVLYNPDPKRLRENIRAVLDQVESLALFDNGSENYEAIADEYGKEQRIELLHSPSNLGIAAALNRLCLWAKEKGYLWILTLDQDSVCGENMVELLSGHTDKEEFGIIYPLLIQEGCTKIKEYPSGTREIKSCFTSGSLTRIEAWEKADGFDEWMFIDYVDYDFCMRLRIAGYGILEDCGARLYHQIGRYKEKQFLWHKVSLYNHSPYRTYHYMRNGRVFAQKYASHIDKRVELRALWGWTIKKLIFEENKKATLKAALQGWRDGGKRIVEIKGWER